VPGSPVGKRGKGEWGKWKSAASFLVDDFSKPMVKTFGSSYISGPEYRGAAPITVLLGGRS
jgi:hypothetical protein